MVCKLSVINNLKVPMSSIYHFFRYSAVIDAGAFVEGKK